VCVKAICLPRHGPQVATCNGNGTHAAQDGEPGLSAWDGDKAVVFLRQVKPGMQVTRTATACVVLLGACFYCPPLTSNKAAVSARVLHEFMNTRAESFTRAGRGAALRPPADA